jgi:hypothetical protein
MRDSERCRASGAGICFKGLRGQRLVYVSIMYQFERNFVSIY